jgi:DNA-binding SARP family transcriptional activator/tetratricopeptide (TPR) repeat protein
MDFRILGGVEAFHNDREVIMGRRQERLLLGLLLLEPRQPVADARLIDLIWGTRAPNAARNTLQTYASRVRSALRTAGADLAYRAGAYLVDCDVQSVDLHRFTALVAASRSAAGFDQQANMLRTALQLWRGPVFGDLASDHLRHWLDANYGELHVTAAELFYEAQMFAGRHGEVIGPLAALHDLHPTRETLTGLRMKALYRAGRQTDALAVYQDTRRAIVEEHGVEPTPALQALNSRILVQDPALTGASDVAAAGSHNLPPPVVGFTGRQPEMDRLDEMRGDAEAGESPVAIVTGMPGVGKTALAVRWAHRVAQDFPDGIVYLDLRGYGPAGQPLRPIDAMARILITLGIAPQDIPVEPERAGDYFRRIVSRLQILLVLDNARSADQVRPLLPNGRRSAAVVTSRDRLVNLVALDGARLIPLDVLDLARSEDLLRSIIGADRFAQAPAAARGVAQLCAGLPLALRIAAASVVEADLPLAAYLGSLKTAGNRILRVTEDPATSLSVVFGYSYDQLSGEEQHLLRLIGALGLPSYGVEALAATAALSLARTHRLLTGLVLAGLIEQQDADRYVVHDLLAGYAADLASPEEVHIARDRLHLWYYQKASAAARCLFPTMLRLEDTAASTLNFIGDASATEWLTVEHACLVAVIRQAADERSRFAWLLCDALRGYFWSVRTYVDWLACCEAAIAAAQDSGDPAALGAAHFSYGTALEYLNQYDEAAVEYDEAYRLFSAAGWNRGMASVAGNHASLALAQGLLTTAAERFERVIEAFRALDLPANVIVQRNNVSNAYYRMGRVKEAYDAAAEAAAWFRAGQPHQLATALLNQGTAAARLGQTDEAIALLAEADRLFAEVGSADGGICVAETVAALHRDAGRLETALSIISGAYDTSREVGDSRVETHSLTTLASIQLRIGNVDDAAANYRRALDQAFASHNRLLEAEAQWGLATVAAALGDLDQALVYAQASTDLAGQIGYRLLVDEATAVCSQWADTRGGSGDCATGV